MKNFLYRLNPPRPHFGIDMTRAESVLMLDHMTYWRGLMNEGHVTAFGSVADPQGMYGITVMQLADSADPNLLVANDPALAANAGFTFAIYPMPNLVLRALMCRRMF